jgi:hypothetical protein
MGNRSGKGKEKIGGKVKKGNKQGNRKKKRKWKGK